MVFFISVVTDQYLKLFFKKNLNLDPSPPTQIQASRKEPAVSHAEREEEPSVVVAGRDRTAEVCRRPRSEPVVVKLPLVDVATSRRRGTGHRGG
jgi:hypothetical protein